MHTKFFIVLNKNKTEIFIVCCCNIPIIIKYNLKVRFDQNYVELN